MCSSWCCLRVVEIVHLLHLFSILGFMLAAAKCDASFGYATFHRPNVMRCEDSMIGPSVNNRSSHVSQSRHRSCRQTAETCNPTHSRSITDPSTGPKSNRQEVHASTVTCEDQSRTSTSHESRNSNETVPPFTSPGEMTMRSGRRPVKLIAFEGFTAGLVSKSPTPPPPPPLAAMVRARVVEGSSLTVIGPNARPPTVCGCARQSPSPVAPTQADLTVGAPTQVCLTVGAPMQGVRRLNGVAATVPMVNAVLAVRPLEATRIVWGGCHHVAILVVIIVVIIIPRATFVALTVIRVGVG